MRFRAFALLLAILPSLALGWFDASWQYRTAIAVNNSGSALTDYQVLVDTTNLAYNNSGLVGSWHFSESAGTRFVDSSGNGNDGTYNGEALNTGTLTNFNFGPASGWVDGKYGKALKFDGADDYVDPATEISGNAAFTISAWAWIDSTKNGDGTIVVTRDGEITYNPATNAFDLTIWADRNGGYSGGYTTRYYYSFVYAGIEDGWAHLAYTVFPDNTAKLYINGTEAGIGSRLTDTGVGSDYNTIIGANIPRNGEFFKGMIDEVRVYNRALSAGEIAQVYQNNTFIRDGLVSYWRLDEGSGTVAQDTHHIATEQNLNGTKFGNALTFDGVNDYAQMSAFNIANFNFGCYWIYPLNISGASTVLTTSNLYHTLNIGGPLGTLFPGSVKKQCNSTVNTKEWSFVCIDLANYKIYKNGNDCTTNLVIAWGPDPFTGLVIGKSYSGYNPFNGTIDEVRIYNRSLSASEIQQLYSAGKLRPDYQDLRFSQPYTIYETPITLSGMGTSLVDYQVSVNITNPTILSHMKADGSDLRFFAAQTSSPYSQTGLPFWIESINTTQAFVWVKANVSAAGSTVYMYYGNPSASPVSSYFNAFDALGDGSSGALTVSSANTIVNTYAYLTGNESAGDSTIAVNNGAGFSNGDEILIIQMQNYSGGTAGTYESRRISSGGGTASLTLNAPLKNSYASGTFDSINATVTQIVRVPQYTDVTVNNGASITAASWNGYSGGIVAFRANGTVTIASGGTITAIAKGFRTGPICCVAIGYINGNGSEGYTGKGNYDQLATSGGGGAGKLCANSNTAGGGGGSYATAGTAGYIQGSCPAGAGSTTIFGSPDLKMLFFGGAGGVGYAGPSSNGGGIIVILADYLNNSGTITSQGGAGGQVIAPSGAGAGGSISIIAGTLATGNNVIATAGASAIAGAGAGGNGRIRLSYNSITGTSNPVAYTAGFDTEHNRKYASPEPSATVGAESVKSSAETPLNYWLESDSRVWVKAASVPAGASTIYAYYGNPNATGASNGSAAFSLFDDFNDGDYGGWTASTGGWSASQGYLRADAVAGAHNIYTASGNAYGIWEFRFRTSGASNSEMFFKMLSAGDGIANNQYAVRINPISGTYFDIRKDVGGLVTVVDGSWTVDTNWHDIRATRNSTGAFGLFLDGQSKGAGVDNTITSTSMLAIHTEGTNYYDFDNIRIRKYASPEPTLSLQQEELQSPALFIGISPASKTTYPGYNETFSVWVYNNQTVSDTFTLSCAGACSVSPPSLFLTPYQNGSATVMIMSANVSGTTAYAITATSQSNASNSAGVSASLTVDVTKWHDSWTDAYGNGFRYRIPIAVSNNGSALTDYQVNFTMDTLTPIGLGRLRGDCGDLRFTNGINEMPYWIESGCNTSSTKIWVKASYVPNGTSTIYAYYGNPSAATASNGTNTFDFFDDFSGDLSKWDKVGSPAIVSGELTILGDGGWATNAVRSVNTFTRPVILEWKEKAPITTMHVMAGYHKSLNAYDGSVGLYKYVINGKEYVHREATSVMFDFPAGGMSQTTSYVFYKLVVLPTIEFQMYRNGTAYTPGTSGTENDYGIGFTVQNVQTEKFDDVHVRKYASPEPSALAGAEQTRGYRVLVRRCGLKQGSANVTAYYSANSTYANSCLTNSTGICTLEISAATYNLLLTYSDNSTAWKNGTVFS